MSLPPSLGENISSFGQRRQLAMLLLRVLFASVFAFLISQTNLDYLESYLYDLRVRFAPAEEVSENIELVLYDQKSVENLKTNLDLNVLGKIVSAVAKDQPKYIMLNVALTEIPGTPIEKKNLARILESVPSLAVTSDDLPLKGDQEGLSLAAPYNNVKIVSAPRTADLKVNAKDGVTRRMLVSYQDQPLFHAEAAAAFNPEVKSLDKISGQFEFARSSQVFINFNRPGTYPRISAGDILNQSPTGKFKNKVVIIGNDTGQSNQDYILTPYSREVMAMTTSEMHANMIDTIIKNAAPTPIPKWINFLIIWLVSVFTVHVVLTMSPAKGILTLGGTVVGFILASVALFWTANLWIGQAAPLLAIFLCYYFFIPYRLIVENRRSWEYYQKNKLLSQVEELKTNFISMMSHDLKTPIARIQGMTDMILKDSVALSTQQREAVDTIKHSSDDLLKFINAILNYGRIESQGVQLNLQSKDINSLLQEVIRKHEFLAKVKRIQIVSELEPLFPVPVDSDLMKQVFSNLVENAIKYSPEDTKILVSSEESDTKVVVQVADQGPGIPADELQNIFMKFFRSKNVKSSPIKGSGLGLYLAKYFTELHEGRIFVESSHGNGSTFTVELPIEQGGTNA
ncbi:CHASE2 and HATPase_c domain-containing protein [Bdellovibrio reynosensis]|uniref:histidine kinase n=1 Tax=Bdellovibrio reynosensis TaxID=2835041 RepID=A0ABY4C7J9_9BACT|nr:CHASE2 and HATPase_c domain-containing protein [Bdellovibrio reynosensis]UOF00905.1 CHASE2 and HATPase_c domain-containing protein [Bdellovibrio reynosensis]